MFWVQIICFHKPWFWLMIGNTFSLQQCHCLTIIFISSDRERTWFQPFCIIVCLAICCLINQIVQLYILTGFCSMVYLVVYLYIMATSPNLNCLFVSAVEVYVYQFLLQIRCLPQSRSVHHWIITAVIWQEVASVSLNVAFTYLIWEQFVGGGVVFTSIKKWFKFLTSYYIYIYKTVLEWIK
jgi:hypothetical protein